MKNYLPIIITATMALFAASCGENYIDEPSTPDTDASAEMEIDSISSKSVFNYVYNDNVVEISDELAEWIMPDELTFSEKQEIRFKPGLANHKELIPKIGQIIVSQPRGDQMPAGYMGRVTRTTPLGDAYVIDTEIVQLEDVYKDLELDYRLNAEQLRNTTAIMATSDYDHDQPLIWEEGEEDPVSSPMKLRKTWDGISLEPKKIGNGYQMVVDGSYDPGKKYPLKFHPKVTITLRPVYKEIRKMIVDNVSGETIESECWELIINGNIGADFNSSKNDALKTLWVRFPTNSMLFSAGVPIRVYNSLRWGLRGKISASVDINARFCIKTEHITSSDGTSSWGASQTNSDWGKDLQFKFGGLDIEGSFGAEQLLGSRIEGAMPLIVFNQTAFLTGKADIADINLYKANPMISGEWKRSLSFRIPKGYIKWMEPKFDIKYSLPTIQGDLFPIFPQIEGWEVDRRKDSPVADVTYRTNLFCLLYWWIPDVEFDIVSEEWLESPSARYVVDHIKPQLDGFRLFDYKYRFNVSGLKPGVNYYAVPICGGYYGQPLSLAPSSKRLGIIGPMEHNPEYRALFAYDNAGRVKLFDNSFIQEKISISYDPFVMTMREYWFDNNGNYVPYPDDSPVSFTDASFDEKAGVLKECRSTDDGEPLRLKLYYNENYNLTGMAGGGMTVSLEWDSDGKLISAIHTEEDYIEKYEFQYPLKLDDFRNARSQWTLITGLPTLYFGNMRLVGRASTYLPTRVTTTLIEDGEKNVTTMDLKYDINKGDGSIEAEYLRVDGEWLRLPYGYRNVSVSPEVYDRDQFLGTTRSGCGDAARLSRILSRLGRFRR